MFSIRDLLFPAPKPPTYDSNSFPDDLIWVPHNVKDEGGNIKSAPIPCVFLAYKGYVTMAKEGKEEGICGDRERGGRRDGRGENRRNPF
eukprot:1392652-Amorphochlora_amoeboformis.AAC.3